MSQLLTPAEVGARLRLSPHWVRRLCRTGELESVRLGRRVRVSEDQLERFVSRHTANRAGRWVRARSA